MTNIIDPPDPDTNNQYNWALWLAQELGVKVFPVDHPGSKTCQGLHEHEPEANNPLTCTDRGKVAAYAFTKKATNKVDTITAWWTGGLYNVGVYMSGSGLIVIDEDLLDALAKYAADNGKEIPITFTVSTAKGRHHYFYDTENGTLGNHEGALAEYGINVRSGNAYVVGPGSMHVSGTVYEVEILAPIVPLPTWIRDAIRAKPNGHKDEPADSSNGFNGFELPKVIRGDRPDRPGERDNVLFAFASSLRAQSINYATAKLMMEMAWSRCEQPPIAHTAFTWDKALAKLDNAYQYPPGRSDGYEPRNGENETEAEDEDDSWIPVDLGAVLDGTFERVQATIGHRNDDVAVLYPGKEHSVIGEPETGKGWLLLHVAADEITRGGRVLYIDFEDDEGTVVGRLHRELGVPADDIKARFFYVRPDSPGIQRYGRLLETTDPTLVMLDGVTEGYGLHGWQIKENDDSPKWRTAFVKPAMRRGAATLSTDHVVKNGEARNGYAIGGQHKKAGLTGVLFELINVQPFGKGMRGKSKLVIHKDRNGDLRQHGIPDSKQPRIAHFADLYLDATGTDLKLELRPPNPPRDPGDSTGEPDKIDGYLEPVIAAIKAMGGRYESERDLAKRLRGVDRVEIRDEVLGDTLARLEAQGRIVRDPAKPRVRRPGWLPEAASEETSQLNCLPACFCCFPYRGGKQEAVAGTASGKQWEADGKQEADTSPGPRNQHQPSRGTTNEHHPDRGSHASSGVFRSGAASAAVLYACPASGGGPDRWS